jgi:3-dehydroquinate synthetase
MKGSKTLENLIFCPVDMPKCIARFGPVEEFPRFITDSYESVVLVIDENVLNYWPNIKLVFTEKLKVHSIFVVPEGEKSKSLEVYLDLVSKLQDISIQRRDAIIGIGGGAICDLVGFLASTFMRGIPYLLVPTTLLAMVDAAHGGKVGINLPKGKNLLGSFFAPSFVWMDIAFLNTLPLRETRQGFGEVVKIALIADDKLFFDQLEQLSYVHTLYDAKDGLIKIIEYCVKKKIELVDPDWKEVELDRLLNLGHEIAHSLEKVVNFKSQVLMHGEAVAIGIAACTRFSRKLDLISIEDAQRIIELIKRLGLPINFPTDQLKVELLDAVKTQERVRNGSLRLVLPQSCFHSFVYHGKDASDVVSFIS